MTDTTAVHSMQITDTMRESVLYEGQPKFSERDRASLLDQYTEEQYNAFGWTRVNDVLTSTELNTLTSVIMQISIGGEIRHPVTQGDEHVILLGNNRDYTKLVYAKRTGEDLVITKVYSGESTVLKEVESLYDGVQLRESSEIIEIYEAAGFIKRSLPRDYPSYIESKARARNGSERAGVGDSARNAGKAGSSGEDSGTVKRASMTTERIDDLIYYSGAQGRTDYAKAWVTAINISKIRSLSGGRIFWFRRSF